MSLFECIFGKQPEKRKQPEETEEPEYAYFKRHKKYDNEMKYYETMLNNLLISMRHNKHYDDAFFSQLNTLLYHPQRSNHMTINDWLYVVNELTNAMIQNNIIFDKDAFNLNKFIEKYVEMLSDEDRIDDGSDEFIDNMIDFVYDYIFLVWTRTKNNETGHECLLNDPLTRYRDIFMMYKSYAYLLSVASEDQEEFIIEDMKRLLSEYNFKSEEVVSFMNHIINIGYMYQIKTNVDNECKQSREELKDLYKFNEFMTIYNINSKQKSISDIPKLRLNNDVPDINVQ